MARIAVLHNTFDFQGGADVVCLHTCGALSRDHDVTVFTISETSLAELAAYFDVDLPLEVDGEAGDATGSEAGAATGSEAGVATGSEAGAATGSEAGVATGTGAGAATGDMEDGADDAHDAERPIAVRSPPGSTPVARALSTAAPWIGPQLAARSAALARYARPRLGAFDLAVSTTNELALPGPSLQYIHVPQFHQGAVPGVDADRLSRLWSALAAPSRTRNREEEAKTTLLANSTWTADVTESIYGRRPTVLHPPVDPIPGEPWSQREDGVVFVGRLAPDKRALTAIDVVDRVRDRGLDLHLHVVGSAPRAYRRYAARVAAAAAERSYVHLERDASRERLEGLLGSHRFGLTAKPHEHFGMALAEYVAAGMVAFAPDSGGQRDVLDHREDRLYGSVEEAAALLARAARDPQPPALAPDRFGSDRFRNAVRRHVDELI